MTRRPDPVIRLHDYVLSSEGYAVRLLLGFLGLAHQRVPVDVHPGRENRSEAFLALNPLGTLPVLEAGFDEGSGPQRIVLREAEAILTWLALRFDPARNWLPESPELQAGIAQWLFFASRDFAPLARLRDCALRGIPVDPAPFARQAQQALSVVEDHLCEREIAAEAADGGEGVWLVGSAPTIAELAVFPPAALAWDAGLGLEPYPALWRWIRRVKALPGFTVMPGIYPDFASAYAAVPIVTSAASGAPPASPHS